MMDNDSSRNEAILHLIAAEQLLSFSAGVVLSNNTARSSPITEANNLAATSHLPSPPVQRPPLKQLAESTKNIRDLRAFRMNDHLKLQDITAQLNPDGLIDLSMRVRHSGMDEHLNKTNVSRTVDPKINDKMPTNHKLSDFPAPEEKKIKIIKRNELRNSKIQTDTTFIVTESEYEILRYIKQNNIKMTSLAKFAEKNDDINNNTEKDYKEPETIIILDDEVEPKEAVDIESLAVKNSENNKNMIFKVFQSLYRAHANKKSEKDRINGGEVFEADEGQNELEATLLTLSLKKYIDKETQTDPWSIPEEVNISAPKKSYYTKRRRTQNQTRNQPMQVNSQTSNHQPPSHQFSSTTNMTYPQQTRTEETTDIQTNGPAQFYQNGNQYERQTWLLQQQYNYQQQQAQYQQAMLQHNNNNHRPAMQEPMLRQTAYQQHHHHHQGTNPYQEMNPRSIDPSTMQASSSQHPASNQQQQTMTTPRNLVQEFQDIELRRVAMDRPNYYPNSAWSKSTRE